jgi:hypothetical protein
VNESENGWINTQSITTKHGTPEKYMQAWKRVTDIRVRWASNLERTVWS